MATHLPFHLEVLAGGREVLSGHLARANPQAVELSAGREVLAVFQGEHGYISPSWYATKVAVPTWSYQAVHAYGTPGLIEDPARAFESLDKLTRQYELPGSPYTVAGLPEEYRRRMQNGIVAFAIMVTRLEAASKLDQGRPVEDLAGSIRGLEAAGDDGSRRLARIMREVHPQAAGQVPAK